MAQLKFANIEKLKKLFYKSKIFKHTIEKYLN